jgi:hypothetical protein
VFAIIGRIQVDEEAGLPAVHALQDQFSLTPLAPPGPLRRGNPRTAPDVPRDLEFWDWLIPVRPTRAA